MTSTMPHKIPFTFCYKKPRTVPPLFLAGSFSDPQWQPKEMDCSKDDDGEHTFRSEIMVEPGKDYQFKFRMGQGDWWILSEEHPVATDDSGNTNNVLNVPSTSEDMHGDDGKNDDAVIKADVEQSPLTATVNILESSDSKDTEDDLKTPLFAHERLGAYEFAEDDSEDEACPSNPVGHGVKLRPNNPAMDAVDLNDPTLEKFPSDRTSVLDALRTIQTHLNEDRPHIDDMQTSPRVVSSSPSATGVGEEMSNSQASLSTGSMRKREQPSYSGFGRSRSAISLGSIAEEPKLDEPGPEHSSTGDMSPDTKEPETPPVITLPNPNTVSAFEEPRSPPSEEDEAVVMKNPELATKEKSDTIAPTHLEIPDSGQGNETGENEPTVVIIPPEIDGSDVNSETDGADDGADDDADDDAPTPKSTGMENDMVKNSLDGASKVSHQIEESMANSRVNAAHGQNATRKQLHGLFSGALNSKLPIIITTGMVAIAVGISWMKNKSDN